MPLSDVPLATQTLSVSQNPIRQNFIDIAAQFAIDHVPFNTAGNGFHNQVTFPRQAGDSPTAGNNVALYSKLNVAGTESALFFRKQTNGVIYDFTSSTQAATGYTRLPSGILIVWSTVGSNAPFTNGLRTYNFPALPIPQFTAVYSMQITPTSSATDAFSAIYFNSVNIGAGTFTVLQQARALGGINQNGFTFVAFGLG